MVQGSPKQRPHNGNGQEKGLPPCDLSLLMGDLRRALLEAAAVKETNKPV